MAWYAELKRRQWHCINNTDMISWYSNKLYQDWYDSLTDEQKERLEEYKRKKREKERKEAEMALSMLIGITNNMLSHIRRFR